jgi:glycosyltransferase involved in cell wall biosynthesis
MFVTVITATYNRSRFIPALIKCYEQQVYPKDQMEWLILDDSDEDERKQTSAYLSVVPSVRYMELPDKKPMGYKLNLLTREAKGQIIIVMDDDDYYPPTRILEAVKALEANPAIDIAGCSKVYMDFMEEGAVYVAGPYHERHALHCTMAFRKRYLLTHRYDDEEVCAVEKMLTNNFGEPMIQLDTLQTILHRVHSSNTYRKKREVGGLRITNYRPEQLFAGY